VEKGAYPVTEHVGKGYMTKCNNKFFILHKPGQDICINLLTSGTI